MSPKDHESLSLEMRRGAVVLAVLSQLRRERYGYSLRERLAEGGMAVPEGTLYPLLRRLEAAGLLGSDWRVVDGRPRRYYKTSRAGTRLLSTLRAEWRALVESVDTLLESK